MTRVTDSPHPVPFSARLLAEPVSWELIREHPSFHQMLVVCQEPFPSFLFLKKQANKMPPARCLAARVVPGAQVLHRIASLPGRENFP